SSLPAQQQRGGAAGGASTGRGNLGTSLSGDTVVRYDRETDSIIIITDDETNSQIAALIEKLDRPVPQVLIKVLFLEVTHSKDLDLGVEGTINFNGVDTTALTDFGVA